MPKPTRIVISSDPKFYWEGQLDSENVEFWTSAAIISASCGSHVLLSHHHSWASCCIFSLPLSSLFFCLRYKRVNSDTNIYSLTRSSQLHCRLLFAMSRVNSTENFVCIIVRTSEWIINSIVYWYYYSLFITHITHIRHTTFMKM